MPKQGNSRRIEPLLDSLAVLRSQVEERLEVCNRLIESGVTVIDPATTYVQPDVQIGRGSVIYPNTTIAGATKAGRRCRLGPNTVILDCTIGDDCEVFASVLEGAVLAEGVDIGPFSHLRPGTQIEAGVHIGNFVEVKASRLGEGTKAGHFSYIGDADVGADVNIGAGTVTCNFDGESKHQTVIEEGAFIGSDTMLVAPVRVKKGGRTGAGSVVTRDVAAGGSVAGVPARAIPKAARKQARAARKPRE
jgi:bifunctional UDP-N-acetylglucosamine pyrophosphorylase/glucosamine-1-phosphate N-acetyltransferase